VHSRFKPGQSGNPKGRRKGARNKRTVVEQALNKRIKVREDGRTRSLRKFEVLVLTMLNKALQGDVKTQIALFGLLRSFGMIGEEPEPTSTEPVTAHDGEIIADFLRRNSVANGSTTSIRAEGARPALGRPGAAQPDRHASCKVRSGAVGCEDAGCRDRAPA
jgi:hypothetical protein